MTDEEKLRRQEEQAVLENQRYEEAVALMLEKKAELGRMPTERELKKDSTVNVGKLVKDLGKRSFSEAVIEVLRYLRAQEGRPRNLAIPDRAQMDKLRELDPDEYARQLELREERELKRQRIKARSIQDRENRQKATEAAEEKNVQKTGVEEARQVMEVVEEKNAQTTEEVAEMSEERTSRRGIKYAYAEIWEFAKEHNLAELTEGGIRELGKELGHVPTFKTFSRLLGPKKFWAEQLACETAEEGEKVRKKLERREQKRQECEETAEVLTEESEVLAEVAAEQEPALADRPKVVTVEKLAEMLGSGGAIDQMLHICSTLKAAWDVVVYIGDTPVEVSLKVEK